MKLSRNFSLSELIKSDTAIRHGIDNNPNADQIEKCKVKVVEDFFGTVRNLQNKLLIHLERTTPQIQEQILQTPSHHGKNQNIHGH